MRYGCCVNVAATRPGDDGKSDIEHLAKAGYDYIELPLAEVAALSEEEYRLLVEQVESSGVRCEACNIFFPRTIRLTGENVDRRKMAEYVQLALARAVRLGVQTVVFGSAGARNVPEGFPHERAKEQLVEALRIIDPYAGTHSITIAIEPLNRGESNIINSVQEGLELAKQVDRPWIKLLADYYHMALENESPEILVHAGDYIRHVHLSSHDRFFPLQGEAGYGPFFTRLRDINYDGRVSIEARTSDFRTDASRALIVLRQL
jgi:D-psicose/D-tagatose/L-ribulose 3-epimerase